MLVLLFATRLIVVDRRISYTMVLDVASGKGFNRARFVGALVIVDDRRL